MRVLLLANAYPSERHPGFGSFVARASAALEAQGHEVERAVLTTRARGRVRTPLKYAELAARGLIASRRRPDVIWAHYLVPTGSIARLVGRARRVPYAITAHGTDVANAEAGGRVAQATATVVRDAAAVIAVSPDLAGRLDALYGPLGERLHAISAGVDLERFADGDRDVAAAALGWSPERPAFVFVGNLVPVKNLTRLVEAFASLGGGALALVGDGPERAALRARAEALGIGDRVRITGEVPSPEVRALAARRRRGRAGLRARGLRAGRGRGAGDRPPCGADAHRGRCRPRRGGRDGRALRPAVGRVDRRRAAAGGRPGAGRGGARRGRALLGRARGRAARRGARVDQETAAGVTPKLRS